MCSLSGGEWGEWVSILIKTHILYIPTCQRRHFPEDYATGSMEPHIHIERIHKTHAIVLTFISRWSMVSVYVCVCVCTNKKPQNFMRCTYLNIVCICTCGRNHSKRLQHTHTTTLWFNVGFMLIRESRSTHAS